MNIRIDSSGNLLVGTDSASTTAKQFLLFLLSQLHENPASTFNYDDHSDIKDVAYDSDTHTLTWLEGGNQQSYSMTTSDLQNYTTTCIGVITSPEVTLADLVQARDAITYAISSAANALSQEHAAISDTLSGITGGSSNPLVTKEDLQDETDEIHAELLDLHNQIRDLTAGGALVGAGLLVTQKPKQTRTK